MSWLSDRLGININVGKEFDRTVKRMRDDAWNLVNGVTTGLSGIASGAGEQLNRVGTFLTGNVSDTLRQFASDSLSSDTLLLGPLGPAKRALDRENKRAARVNAEKEQKQAEIQRQRRISTQAERLVNLEAEARRGFLGSRSLLDPASGGNTLLTPR